MRANPEVKADAWKVAVMRGPIVYCAEEYDNGKELFNLAIDPKEGFEVQKDPDLKIPILIPSKGYRGNNWKDKSNLYTNYFEDFKKTPIKLIPYAMWGNREKEIPSEMAVWLNVQR